MTKKDDKVAQLSRVARLAIKDGIDQSRSQIAESDDILSRMRRLPVIDQERDRLQYIAAVLARRLGRMVFVWNPDAPLPVMMPGKNSIQ